MYFAFEGTVKALACADSLLSELHSVLNYLWMAQDGYLIGTHLKLKIWTKLKIGQMVTEEQQNRSVNANGLI